MIYKYLISLYLGRSAVASTFGAAGSRLARDPEFFHG